MPEGTDIGARLRKVRKRRGMTQAELAEASGVGVSTIRKLEQGRRTDLRLETARRLAAAMGVTTTTLLAVEREDPEAGPRPGDAWGAVRAALDGTASDDDLEEPPTEAGVASALDAVVAQYSAGDLARVGALLPPLIRDAEALAALSPAGTALYAQVMQITGRLMTQTRQYGAAEAALSRAEPHLADELHGASLANARCWLLLRRGQLEESLELAVGWADDVEPRLTRASAAELSAWGWLLLRVAASSVRDARPDEAEEALFFAQAAASALGRRRTDLSALFLRPFSPVIVALQRAEHAMVEDRPDEVLRLAARVRGGLRSLPRTAGNRNRHLLDVAYAHTRKRQYGDAVKVLTRVAQEAPQWLPHQRYAKDILGHIIARRRTLTPQMRHLADAMGMPL